MCYKLLADYTYNLLNTIVCDYITIVVWLWTGSYTCTNTESVKSGILFVLNFTFIIHVQCNEFPCTLCVNKLHFLRDGSYLGCQAIISDNFYILQNQLLWVNEGGITSEQRKKVIYGRVKYGKRRVSESGFMSEQHKKGYIRTRKARKRRNNREG